MNSDVRPRYQRATKRLLLLDYDGVLVPIVSHPEKATPAKSMLEILEKLATDEHNTCVIVTGRPRDTMEKWLGHLPLAFAAEHGLWRKQLGMSWEIARDVPTDWKEAIRGMMDRYERVLPGSFIEEKYASLAFHYRSVSGAEDKLEELKLGLEKLATDLSLRLIDGKKVFEVVVAGVDKGTAARFWLEDGTNWEFILGAGDDTTDEAMFRILPSRAFSIKVGPGPTAATRTLPSQSKFMELLRSLL